MENLTVESNLVDLATVREGADFFNAADGVSAEVNQYEGDSYTVRVTYERGGDIQPLIDEARIAVHYHIF